MDDMDDDQLGVIKAHCRCGSRLPWNQCHAARLEMYHSVHRKNKNPARDNLAYIVSPLAKCPCRKTKKTYYTCCWKDISTVYLLTDDNGAIWPFEACAPEFVMKDLSDMSSEDYALYVGQIWPDFIAMMCSPSSCDEKSKLSTWDPDVYTGVSLLTERALLLPLPQISLVNSQCCCLLHLTLADSVWGALKNGLIGLISTGA